MEPHQAPSQTPQDQFLAACELLKAGKIVEATWAAEALINQFPKLPVGHLLRSMVHERQHNLPAATSEIEAALERAPQDPLALATAARIAFHRGDFSTTQAMADRISRDAGAWRDGQWWKARASNAMEHPEEAIAILDAIEPTAVRDAVLAAALEARLGRDESARSRLTAVLERGPIQNRFMRRAAFDLAAVCDRLGEYDTAFAVARKSNAATPKSFDAAQWQAHAKATIATYQHDTYQPKAPCHGPCPVFLIGFPMSGQRHVHDVLAEHPEVHTCEARRPLLSTLQQLHRQCIDEGPTACADSIRQTSDQLRQLMLSPCPDARVVLCRAPLLDRLAGVIPLCLPEAKLIICTRDPLDAILATYLEHLSLSHHPYATNLIDLSAAYASHRQLMSHWATTLPSSMHTVRYESLTDNQRHDQEALFRFLDLPGDHAHEARHALNPKRDPGTESAPPSDASWKVGHWKHYATHLETLKHAIDALESSETPEAGT